MTLRAAIVADDLTGALDAAAPFAARGLYTLVASTPDALDQALARAPDVLAVNTATRHAHPEAATATVQQQAQHLAQHAPDILFKKIDSTLRGPVANEVAAAVSASGRRALICPAVPAQGRSVRDGRLFVNGQPLRASAAAHDRRTVVHEDDIPKLLGATLGTIARARATPPWPPHGHVVVDAETADDLSFIAARIKPDAREWLPVGASGLAEALAETTFGPRRFTAKPVSEGPALFVVGSQTETTRAQVRAVAERDDVTLLSARKGQFDHRAPAGPGHTLLWVPEDDAGHDPESVARNLGTSARSLIQKNAPGLLVVTGGDTALALLAALDAPIVTVLGEFAAGVVQARIDADNRQIPLVTKAGGFGDRQLFVDLVRHAAPTNSSPK